MRVARDFLRALAARRRAQDSGQHNRKYRGDHEEDQWCDRAGG